jgi:hypothetical protein
VDESPEVMVNGCKEMCLVDLVVWRRTASQNETFTTGSENIIYFLGGAAATQ